MKITIKQKTKETAFNNLSIGDFFAFSEAIDKKDVLIYIKINNTEGHCISSEYNIGAAIFEKNEKLTKLNVAEIVFET